MKTLQKSFLFLLSILFFISCDTPIKDKEDLEEEVLISLDANAEEEKHDEEKHISNFDAFEIAYLNDEMEEVLISEQELLNFVKRWMNVPLEVKAERIDVINNSPYHKDAIRIKIPSHAQFAIFIENSKVQEGRYLLTHKFGSCVFNDCENCSLKIREESIHCTSCDKEEADCFKNESNEVDFKGFDALLFS